jgi:hypothetical protein
MAEEEPPFLSGQTDRTDGAGSPVRIVKNPDGSLQRAALNQVRQRSHLYCGGGGGAGGGGAGGDGDPGDPGGSCIGAGAGTGVRVQLVQLVLAGSGSGGRGDSDAAAGSGCW